MTDSTTACDLVILGGTPGGIATAIAAARLGRSVAIVEPHAHLGGMAASGLGKSDVENREVIGGIFAEFVQRVYRHYEQNARPGSDDLKLCRNGYYYEPSVAEHTFERMIAETGSITLLVRHHLQSVAMEGRQLAGINVVAADTGQTRHLSGRVLVDATYEGDLFAAAGAAHRLGRESRHRFNEPHAGVIYYDYENRRTLPGSTGEGDDRLPAYTYRLCLTTDPHRGVPITEPPEDYDPAIYERYHDDLEAGRLAAPKVVHDGWGYYPEHFDTLVRALSVTEIPNGKIDANINPRPLAFPFPEENIGYVQADHITRARIAMRHRNLAIGLLWFLQNDPTVPEPHRRMARHYQLPRDEFADNGHFPWQLYVREARRLTGSYTLTEHDVAITPESPDVPVHRDVIAMGEFPIDSFPVRKRQTGDQVVLEGYLGMLSHITQPYPIPYRVLIPQEVEGLMVPVALSATHVAYSSVRMEPTWMAIGHAAGVAAHLAIMHQCPLRDVPITELQSSLRTQGQRLQA